MATVTGTGTLLGTTSDDAITAGAGNHNDILIGENGSDTLSGGDGDDILAPMMSILDRSGPGGRNVSTK